MKSFILLLTLCVFPSVLCIGILYTSVTHIFFLKKGKTAIKNIAKEFSVWERIFLCHVRKYRNECVVHKKTLKFFLVFCDIYCVLFIVILIACQIALMIGHEKEMIVILKIKGFVLDAPIFLYSFCMTKHDKVHGGVTYRWKP